MVIVRCLTEDVIEMFIKPFGLFRLRCRRRGDFVRSPVLVGHGV